MKKPVLNRFKNSEFEFEAIKIRSFNIGWGFTVSKVLKD